MKLTRTVFIAAVIAVFALSAGHPQVSDPGVRSVDVSFDLGTEQMKQSMTFRFDGAMFQENVSYTLNEQPVDVQVLDDSQSLNYGVQQNGDSYTIQIFMKNPTEQLTLRYTLNNVIFTGDSVRHFFTEIDLPNTDNLTVRAVMPKGYGLHQNSFRPSGGVTSSDGQRIILEWSSIDASEPVLFSVKYAPLQTASGAAGDTQSGESQGVGSLIPDAVSPYAP